MIPELSQSDKWTINFIEGWNLLGDYAEATREYEKLSTKVKLHPAALSARFDTCIRAEWIEAAWIISKILCKVLPDSPIVWICRANTLRKLKGDKAAYDLALEIRAKFPEDGVVNYNLACYAAQAGLLDEARQALKDAFEKSNGPALKIAATHDPDLKPLFADK